MGIFGKIEKIVKIFPFIFVPNGLNRSINLCKIEKFINFINNIINSDRDSQKEIINLHENENYNLEDLVHHISKTHNKKIKVILINYKIILHFLKLLEFFNIRISLSSDSLKSLIRYIIHPILTYLLKVQGLVQKNYLPPSSF